MFINKKNMLNSKILCQNHKEFESLWYILYDNNIREPYINNFDEKYNDLFSNCSYTKNKPIWFAISRRNWYMNKGFHFFFRMNEDVINGVYDEEKYFGNWDKEYKTIQFNDIINYIRKQKLIKILK